VSINDLDKLIEELLQEFKVTITGKGKNTKYEPNIGKELGVPKKTFKLDKIGDNKSVKQFAKLAKKPNELDINDFSTAFDGEDPYKTIAQNVLKTTNKADVFNALKNLNHGFNDDQLENTPGNKAVLRKMQDEEDAQQKIKNTHDRAVKKYNSFVQRVSDLGLEVEKLKNNILSTASGENLQAITLWNTETEQIIQNKKNENNHTTEVQKYNSLVQQASDIGLSLKTLDDNILNTVSKENIDIIKNWYKKNVGTYNFQFYKTKYENLKNQYESLPNTFKTLPEPIPKFSATTVDEAKKKVKELSGLLSPIKTELRTQRNQLKGLYDVRIKRLSEMNDTSVKELSEDDQNSYSKLKTWLDTNQATIDQNYDKYEKKKATQEVIKYLKEKELLSPTYTSMAIKATDEKLSSFQAVNRFLIADFTTPPTYDQWRIILGTANAQNIIDIIKTIENASEKSNTREIQKLIALINLTRAAVKADFKSDKIDKDQIVKSLFEEYLTSNDLKKSMTPYSFNDPSLKLTDLVTKSVTDDVFSKLKLSDTGATDEAKIKFMELLASEFAKTKLTTLKENINPAIPFSIEQVEELIKDTKGEINQEEVDRLKTAFKETYKAIKKDTKDIEYSKEDKKELLTFLSSLLKATDYYASGRQLRTKRGPTTGWKVGTAQTSGTARLDKEVSSMMTKAGGSTTDIKSRLKEYSNFLDKVNNINETGKIDGDISQTFSQYVGLEILNDNLFQTEEAAAKGFMFEAFLALLSGGKQVGAGRGGEDYIYQHAGKPIYGSAKLINSTKFSQAISNLKTPMEYVVAVKYIRTKEGLLKLAEENDKIRYLKIYVVYSDKVKEEDGALILPRLGTSPDNYTGKSTKLDNKVQFDLDTLNDAGYVCDFDFTFLQDTEFSDISSTILSKISEQVEQAFSSLTSLRDNITKWVSDQDLVAANQVEYDQQDLKSAIAGMRNEKGLKDAQLSESMKQLDKLILEILQESLDK